MTISMVGMQTSYMHVLLLWLSNGYHLATYVRIVDYVMYLGTPTACRNNSFDLPNYFSLFYSVFII